MWEEVARRVREIGGVIQTGCAAERILARERQVTALEIVSATGARQTLRADYIISTAPVKELIRMFDPPAPANVREVSDGLVYRDFITVGLLVSGLSIHDQTPHARRLIGDNWIYIQEPGVLVGRLQIYNNWSPHLVKDPSLVWLGLEYFCNSSDEIWRLDDASMVGLAACELSRIGIIEPSAVLDATVLRVEKAYPADFGSYGRFAEIRDYVDRYENLFLVGRNGMHRYNNQDHSMLTAMLAVEHILAGETAKSELWAVNTASNYIEEKREETPRWAKDGSISTPSRPHHR